MEGSVRSRGRATHKSEEESLPLLTTLSRRACWTRSVRIPTVGKMVNVLLGKGRNSRKKVGDVLTKGIVGSKKREGRSSLLYRASTVNRHTPGMEGTFTVKEVRGYYE